MNTPQPLSRRDFFTNSALATAVPFLTGVDSITPLINGRGGDSPAQARSVYNVRTVVGDSNSLMSLAENIVAGDVAIADGYSALGDGGGGIFYFEGTPPPEVQITVAKSTAIDILEVTTDTPISIKTGRVASKVVTMGSNHPFSTGQSVLIQNVGVDTECRPKSCGKWAVDNH
jgi:hypothetical protein